MTAWQWVGTVVASIPLGALLVAMLHDEEMRWVLLVVAGIVVWITAVLMAGGCIPPTPGGC